MSDTRYPSGTVLDVTVTCRNCGRVADPTREYAEDWILIYDHHAVTTWPDGRDAGWLPVRVADVCPDCARRP